MTDEQLEKLIEGLRPAEKTRWQNLVDNSLGLVLGALAVGFFALLWQSRADVESRAGKLETRAMSIEQSILGLQEPSVRLQPFPNVKSEEVIKAVREKEDSIDKRFRQYEQRAITK